MKAIQLQPHQIKAIDSIQTSLDSGFLNLHLYITYTVNFERVSAHDSLRFCTADWDAVQKKIEELYY